MKPPDLEKLSKVGKRAHSGSGACKICTLKDSSTIVSANADCGCMLHARFEIGPRAGWTTATGNLS
jgi:hypothetical protein